ncbi:MAG: MBL fold metallo-hydrolase [Bacteroidetes bacterium]|nr:MBL fold metallo-hydrolase [Bacteroidota bacterium]
MMTRVYKILTFLFISALLSSCGYLNIFFNNVGDSITTEPKKVAKVENPIKDSVKISVLWVGHSTTFVQIYDKVLFFDPFFNKRFGGVLMRQYEPGIDLDKVKRLDYIFVSHSHMDHLSFTSIGELADRFPKAKLIFPDGVENYMPGFNLDMIRLENHDAEYKDYIGKSVMIDGLKVTPVFAQHSGGRYGVDVYSWFEPGATGFILEYKDAVLYYGGDTGYNPEAFKKIGERFKIDVALIPVGPCRNCDSTSFWFHTTSMETLKLFRDIKASYMIPVHYGAAKYMSDPNKPLDVMNKILDDPESGFADLKPRVKELKVGEQVLFN